MIEEVSRMQCIWRRKWLLIALTAAVFLSVGAVAWAAGTGATGTATAESDQSLAAGGDQELLTAAGNVALAWREAFKEKRERWLERRQALMQLVREQMTPEDQAAYDRLVQTAKDQRAALKEAREALQATLQELRELAAKYLDVESAAAGATGAQ
jgi:hypothetical protein